MRKVVPKAVVEIEIIEKFENNDFRMSYTNSFKIILRRVIIFIKMNESLMIKSALLIKESNIQLKIK